MTEAQSSNKRRRAAWEWLALIALPLLVNVGLALFLFGQAKNGDLPGFSDPGQTDLPLPSGEIGEGLPRRNFQRVIEDVRAATGRSYTCEGPWRASEHTIAWACREHDSLAVLRGFSPTIVFAVEVTWFGFDPSATDLPAWAAGVFERPEDARRAASWVAAHVGEPDAKTTIDGVELRTGGARGAITLDVSR